MQCLNKLLNQYPTKNTILKLYRYGIVKALQVARLFYFCCYSFRQWLGSVILGGWSCC